MLEPKVRYDFARFYPNDIFSWRGSYDQLALNYARDFRNDPPKRLSEFLTMLEQAVGADFDGYKGGEYTMDLDTCVWVDDWGDYTSTGITGITYNGTDVIENSAIAESPITQPVPDVSVSIRVGGAERPAFIDQARWLSDAWGCSLQIVPDLHHFDIIDALEDPASPAVAQLLS